MTSSKRNKIIFLNQMAGPMFRELAEDLSKVWEPSILFTGHPDTLKAKDVESLTIQSAPGYDRRSNLRRLFSWVHYFFSALFMVWKQPKDELLFIVSNPPYLGLLGLFFKIIRKQKYVVLVYDVYPDLLIELGRIKKGLLSKMWLSMNRKVYQNADIVFTIGSDVAERLEHQFDTKKTRAGKIISIPCWADLNVIKPIANEKNWFAEKHVKPNTTTVLYSGNMGNTHDIESILEVAKRLSCESGIHFLFIGEGAKWALVENAIKDEGLKNITLLPFQPEEVLPYSITSGDIGIVAYQKGTEGCMVPSKSYYYMAAGMAILVVGNESNTVSEAVEQFNCGVNIKSGDIEGMANAILKAHNNPEQLESFKQKARQAAETLYSRKNTEKFTNAIESILS